jgi:carboxymethylenebutenolidase
MAERRTEHFPLLDGSQLRLTIVEPDSAPRGGIVVVHEARGVTDNVLHLAQSLAREGWLAVVPHLYHRCGDDALPDADDEDGIRRQVHQLSAVSVLADADACCQWLAARQLTADLTGIVGFGLGGSIALLVAAEREMGAAVTVGGIGVVRPVSPALRPLIDAAPELRCPWLGIYAAGSETPEDEVNKLQDAAYSAQVATDLVYFAEDKCRFDTDQPAAVEAWTRTLNWFDSHLR